MWIFFHDSKISKFIHCYCTVWQITIVSLLSSRASRLLLHVSRRLGNDFKSFVVLKEDAISFEANWHAARDKCLGLGRDLLSISDESTWTDVKNRFWNNEVPMWHGQKGDLDTRTWSWIDGTIDTGFSSYATGEPNFGWGEQACGNLQTFTRVNYIFVRNSVLSTIIFSLFFAHKLLFL